MYVRIKRLNQLAKIPVKGSVGSAGYDIYAALPRGEAVIINPGECAKIPTGFATEIPHGCFGAIYARSGLASNRGLRPAQGTAVIDEDYRGEWFVPLYNDSDDPQKVYGGDRIAQVVFQKYEVVDFANVDELGDTERDSGGFGSTGTN